MLRSTWSEKNVEHSGTCIRVYMCFCCIEGCDIWRKLLVDAVWQWGRVVVSMSRCMCDVVNAWLTVAIVASNLSVFVRITVTNSFGSRNYMGEVSRPLVVSPRLSLMETFFLSVFCSLVGIDAPYFCFIVLKYYYLIFHYYSSDGCCNVM